MHQTLSEAARFASRAVDEAQRANEAVLDTAEALGVAPDDLVSPETDLALENASEKVNEASTEVSVALTSARG